MSPRWYILSMPMIGGDMIGGDRIGGDMIGGDMIGGDMIGENMIGGDMIGDITQRVLVFRCSLEIFISGTNYLSKWCL